MPFVSTQPEAGMDHLQGFNAIVLRYHTARADLTGGDEANVYLSVGEGPKHPSCGAGGCTHPSTNSTHPSNRIAVF